MFLPSMRRGQAVIKKKKKLGKINNSSNLAQLKIKLSKSSAVLNKKKMKKTKINSQNLIIISYSFSHVTPHKVSKKTHIFLLINLHV